MISGMNFHGRIAGTRFFRNANENIFTNIMDFGMGGMIQPQSKLAHFIV